MAGVVDRKRGTVKIYMNGKLTGTARFKAGTPVESTYIRSSHFLVGGVTDQQPWGTPGASTAPKPKYLNHAFVGKVDEVRLYFRALADKEIKQVYDLHAGLAN